MSSVIDCHLHSNFDVKFTRSYIFSLLGIPCFVSDK